MIESGEQLEGRRLAPGESFSFACRPGLACFNTCCAHKRLLLLPYDLLRLRRGLGLDSATVLERFVELDLDPVSGWPVLRLRLDDQGRCPFVGPQGCGVYAHRPAACRVYPLARAVAPGPDGRPAREVFLAQEAPGCLGWDQRRSLTVEAWVADQGLGPFQEANDALLGLFCHPRRHGRLELEPAQIHGVILALYNLDVFRRLAAQPEMARRQGLPEVRLPGALASDEALLDLGRDWLLNRLFGEPLKANTNSPSNE